MSFAKRQRENERPRPRAGGPHASRADSSRARRNAYMQDTPFCQIPLTLLGSDHFKLLTHAALKVFHRILIEYMKHAGQDNGRLIVTYNDFIAYGVRKSSINHAIKLLETAGFIRVERGAFRGKEKRPSKFALTFYGVDHLPPTNDWKKVDPRLVAETAKVHKKTRGRSGKLREKHTT
jgi:hypothetical protein